MEHILTLQVAILVSTCILVSYTDLKNGKIPNKILLFAFVIGTIFNVYNLLTLDKFFIINHLVNGVFLIIISLLLFKTHTWAGGDTKLLMLIAYLIPAKYYVVFEEYRFTWWLLVMYIFSVGYILILVDTVVLTSKNRTLNGRQFKKKLIDFFLQYIKSIIFISAFSHIYIYFISPTITVNNIVYTMFCILLLIVIGKIEVFKERVVVVAFFLFDVLFTILTGVIPISTNIINYILVLFFMMIQIMSSEFNYKNIRTDELSKGMILTLSFTLLFRNAKTKNLPMISDETLQSRLTEIEVESVKRWSKSKGIESIEIVRKIPFAICITIGLIIYMVIGGLFF